MTLFRRPVLVVSCLGAAAAFAAFWGHVGSVAEASRSAGRSALKMPVAGAQSEVKSETPAQVAKAKQAAQIAAAAVKLAARVAEIESQPQEQGYVAQCAMVAWAACDPVAAGEWLNAHKTSPHFASFARAYAVQAAVDDSAAARKWAALADAAPRPRSFLEMGLYGSLESTIRGVEEMMSRPSSPEGSAPSNAQTAQDATAVSWHATVPVLAEYHPVLVRMAEGAEPVIMMQPFNPMACRPCHGTLQVPEKVMVMSGDGTLRPESSVAATP